MGRRNVQFVLLFAGVVPVVWAISIAVSDPSRAGVLAALGLIGIVLNSVALGRREFGISVPLRVIACGVALAVFAGVMAMWQWIRTRYLPDVPVADARRREVWTLAAHNLVWIACAVGYVILTVLVTPTPPAKPRPTKPERIDFRKYGRQGGSK